MTDKLHTDTSVVQIITDLYFDLSSLQSCLISICWSASNWGNKKPLRGFAYLRASWRSISPKKLPIPISVLHASHISISTMCCTHVGCGRRVRGREAISETSEFCRFNPTNQKQMIFFFFSCVSQQIVCVVCWSQIRRVGVRNTIQCCLSTVKTPSSGWEIPCWTFQLSWTKTSLTSKSLWLIYFHSPPSYFRLYDSIFLYCRFGLKPNDQILAEDKHKALWVKASLRLHHVLRLR